MSEWPAKLDNVTADAFASMDSEALLEGVGPWLLDALESGKAPAPIAHAGAAYLLFVELANGGLEQFLANSSRDSASAAEAALRVIGLEPAAAVLSQAAAQLPEGFTGWDGDRRWDFTSRDAAIETAGNALWSAIGQDDFAETLASYVRRHHPVFAPYFDGNGA